MCSTYSVLYWSGPSSCSCCADNEDPGGGFRQNQIILKNSNEKSSLSSEMMKIIPPVEMKFSPNLPVSER